MNSPDVPGGVPAEGPPVFAEPWQAQAFALTVELHRRGAFTWSEWSAALGARRDAAPVGDDGEVYYTHWLEALELLLARKALADPAALAKLKTAWADAYRDTPHGRPVAL